MNLQEIIRQQIESSIATKVAVLETISPDIAAAGKLLSDALQQGNKVLCCGNGGSASDAQHFSAELLGRYVDERRSLAAICLNTDTSTLTAIANDYGYKYVFSRQIQGLGNTGDVLLAITTSGNSENIINAVQTAQQNGMRVIALTGKSGGKLAAHLSQDDLHLCVPAEVTSRIQEAHILILHCLCEIIDQAIVLA